LTEEIRMNDVSPLQDLEAAEVAFGRVKAELEALPLAELATMNVLSVRSEAVSPP
jgi:hypothetical protein